MLLDVQYFSALNNCNIANVSKNQSKQIELGYAQARAWELK